MLSWNESNQSGAAAAPGSGALSAGARPMHTAPEPDAEAAGRPKGRVRAEDKRIINGHTDVNQLVPFKYKWAWDKYLSACANHWMPQEVNMARDIALWKDPRRADRGRAARRQAQPGVFRHGRFAGRQQHRAGNVSPHHGAGMPPVPVAPGLRGGDPHPRLPVHRRVARPGRGGNLQRLPRGAVDPGQGRVPDPVHRHADRPVLQDRHPGSGPDAAAGR